MYKRTQAYTGLQQRSQRDFLFELLSDNMLPTSLMRAVSKTSTCSLIPHLPSSTLPSLSASLSTTSPASSLVQTEVDNMGIATVLANHVLGLQGVDEKQFHDFLGKAGQGSCQLPQPWTSSGENLDWHAKLFCLLRFPSLVNTCESLVGNVNDFHDLRSFMRHECVCTVYLLHENEF